MNQAENPAKDDDLAGTWRSQIKKLLNRPVLVALIVAPIAYLAAGLASLEEHKSKPVTPTESIRIDERTSFESQKNQLKAALDANPELTSLSNDYTLDRPTIFSSAVIRAYAIKNFNGTITYRFRNEIKFDTANFVALVGIWLALVYLYNQWANTVSKLVSSIKSYRTTIRRVEPSTTDKATPQFSTVAKDSIETIFQDVLYGRKRADELFYRSTIILIAGIAMAFIGVAVFYFSVKDVRNDIGSGALAIEILRPGSMLIFLEAVAWFLLNQYRLHSGEYRQYHVEVSRRTDLLAAMHLAKTSDSKEAVKSVLDSLLKQSDETILRAGETTPRLESEKLGSQNPVFQLAQDLVKKIPNMGSDGKKDA